VAVRVAWDLQAITGPRPTGLGVAVKLLLEATLGYAPGIEVIGLRPNEVDRPLRGVPDRLLWEQWRLPAALRREHAREGLDLMFSPALGAPFSSPVPVVAHIPDLIPLHYPRQFGGVAGWYWKQLLPASWARSRAIVTSNSAVADDIAARLDYPRDRIHIVPYCVDASLFERAKARQREKGLGHFFSAEPLFYTLGTHEPRKNLELAIRAFVEFTAGGNLPGILRCFGINTAHTSRLREQAGSAHVEFHDYATREQLIDTMLGATALLFPSRYEGFGLPPLEALSLGCPVVLSDIPVHRAVYDDPERWDMTGETFCVRPPFVGVDDVSGLAEIMRRLTTDMAWQGVLRESGRQYSRTFTAAATAQALEVAFRSALMA
jgi:glycosyltransferase involved in cell wall biosynthesis